MKQRLLRSYLSLVLPFNQSTRLGVAPSPLDYVKRALLTLTSWGGGFQGSLEIQVVNTNNTTKFSLQPLLDQ